MRDLKVWFSDLYQFLWAVLNSWAGYTTGGIVVALAWLWSTISQTAMSRKPGIILALFFLFMAFFNAWRKQYREKLALATDPAQRRYAERVAQLTFISKFISDGQYLLFVNPGEEATAEEIKEWKFKVQQWQEEVSNFLWAIGRTKFNDLTGHQGRDFHGAHRSIWSELSFLQTRVRNLMEILEKPEIYLAGMRSF
ncbi:MAG TPA: hypothetical protein VGK24_04745 [Candidatus Angelobacter sp.]